MSSREHWDTVCQKNYIPISIATIWYDKLAINYKQNTRYYHNEQVLEQKFNFLKQNVIANGDNGDGMLRSHLIFAIFFQYYKFDVKRNCATENCDAFRYFYNQAALNDVSICSVELLYLCFFFFHIFLFVLFF